MDSQLQKHPEGNCEKEALRTKVKTLESRVHELEIRELQHIEEIRKLKKLHR